MLKEVIYVSLVLAYGAFGQDTQKGMCGLDLVGIPNFNINDYAGTWYQLERISNQYESACSRSELTLSADGSLAVNSTQVTKGALRYTVGTAKVDSADGSGRLHHVFQFTSRKSVVTVSATHIILSLDRSSHALVVACADISDSARSVFAWKLSRTKNGFTPEAKAAIDSAVAASSYLSSVAWEKTDQSVETCGSSA